MSLTRQADVLSPDGKRCDKKESLNLGSFSPSCTTPSFLPFLRQWHEGSFTSPTEMKMLALMQQLRCGYARTCMCTHTHVHGSL